MSIDVQRPGGSPNKFAALTEEGEIPRLGPNLKDFVPSGIIVDPVTGEVFFQASVTLPGGSLHVGSWILHYAGQALGMINAATGQQFNFTVSELRDAIGSLPSTYVRLGGPVRLLLNLGTEAEIFTSLPGEELRFVFPNQAIGVATDWVAKSPPGMTPVPNCDLVIWTDGFDTGTKLFSYKRDVDWHGFTLQPGITDIYLRGVDFFFTKDETLYVAFIPPSGMVAEVYGNTYGAGLYERLPYGEVSGRLGIEVEMPTEQTLLTMVGSSPFLLANFGHTSTTGASGGLAVPYRATGLVDTVVNGTFSAGYDGVQNSSIPTVGADTFDPGMIVQLVGSPHDDGLYEVLDHTGNVLTFRGVGLSGNETIEAFTKKNSTTFINVVVESAEIRQVEIGALQISAQGNPQSGKGAETGIEFKDVVMLGAGGTDLFLSDNDGNLGTDNDGNLAYTFDEAV